MEALIELALVGQLCMCCTYADTGIRRKSRSIVSLKACPDSTELNPLACSPSLLHGTSAPYMIRINRVSLQIDPVRRYSSISKYY